MDTRLKNRIYWEILTNHYNINLKLNYWELNWDETTTLYKLADAFNIKPKAGATAGRTLFERAQKGRPF